MLNIYIGKENLPSDKKFIFDVEAVFLNVNMSGTDLQKRVIKVLDKGVYFDKLKFKDRFGNLLYHSELSTSSKALIELEALKDYVINFDEVGLNAIDLLQEIDEGSVYFESRSDSIGKSSLNMVTVNSQVMTVEHLNMLIGKGDFCGSHCRIY